MLPQRWPARRVYRGGIRWHGAHLRDKTFRLAEAKAFDWPIPKVTSRRSQKLCGLRRLAAVCGDRFAGCVVLYDGETTTRFGNRLYAVPVRRLWETS